MKGVLPPHCWESAGGLGPGIRHIGDDGDGHYEGDAGTESPQNPKLLVPESQEQKRTERPFRYS